MNQGRPEPDDAPFPPRLWWTKRIALSGLTLGVLLALARFWWGYSAHRALQARVDALHAAGEPVSVADIQPLQIDDQENAAVLWQQAMSSINGNVETPSQSNLEFQLYPPWSDEWHQLLETGVKGNAKAIALARQARSRTKVDWKLAFVTPLSNTLLPTLNDARNLADVLGDAALHAHLHDDDFEAIERIRDTRRLADDLSQQPFIISEMVAVGIHALALSRLEMITPDLQIVGTTDSRGHPATRAQIRSLIDELLAESVDTGPLHRAFATERLNAIDMMQYCVQKAPLTAPMFERASLEDLDAYDFMVRAADQIHYSDAKPLIASSERRNWTLPPVLTTPVPSDPDNAPRISRILSRTFRGSYNRVFEMGTRIRVENSMAAISLAARLYRLDHGEWPATIDALTPTYLPSVPRDPFATNSPVGYMLVKHSLPDGADRPVVYSVDAAGDIDVDVARKYLPPTPTFGWVRGSIQFRDLSRWSPPATTRPEDSSP